MGRITGILSGMGILIGLFLLLKYRKATTSIVSQLGSSMTSTVKTLQGR